MTDPRHEAQVPSRQAQSQNGTRRGVGVTRRRPRALPTVLAALACFAVAFEFLAFQLQGGHDPALGDKAAVTRQAKTKPARRIVITKVVPPTSGAAAAGSGSSTASPSAAAAAAPAPVTTASS